MKYVIVHHTGCEIPYMFPDMVQHETFTAMNPISAGKFTIRYDGKDKLVVHTYGRSVGLKLESRPEDADIIEHAFKFEGA
jgi:hypothetical protein